VSRCVLLAFAVALALVLASARSARACQCRGDAPAYDVERARKHSALIVEGLVEGHGPQDGYSGQRRVALVDVNALRGAHHDRTLILENGGDCAPAELHVGRRYVIYLSESGDRSIDACSRVIELAMADAELAVLRAGAPPRANTNGGAGAPPGRTQVEPPGSERGGCASCGAAVPAGPAPEAAGAAILALSMLVARGRRRQR
jgi:hypothetical protein